MGNIWCNNDEIIICQNIIQEQRVIIETLKSLKRENNYLYIDVNGRLTKNKTNQVGVYYDIFNSDFYLYSYNNQHYFITKDLNFFVDIISYLTKPDSSEHLKPTAPMRIVIEFYDKTHLSFRVICDKYYIVVRRVLKIKQGRDYINFCLDNNSFNFL